MSSLSLKRALAIMALTFPFAGAMTASDEPAPTSYWVYFGTYTGKGPQDSKGIYRSEFNPATGKLAPAELVAEVTNPTFLAIHPSGKFLYAVGEVSNAGGKNEGGVHAYSINGKTGALTKLNDSTSGGPGPCHIAVHPNGTLAAVANYGGGSTAVLQLKPDGSLGETTAFVQHKGNGPNKGRQEGPHAHCVGFDPAAALLRTSDLGLDRVKAFMLDTAKGTIADNAKADIVMPPGSGPRHFTMATGEHIVYVCGELDSTANVVKIDSKSLKAEVVQSLSTLPEGWKGNNSTAEILRHPSGRWVYVSNRGHNSVAVFAVGADKKLTAAGHITGDIKTPRNFNIDPSGRWMLIASQDGGKVDVFEIDPKTGLAKKTESSVAVSKPVCVRFIVAAK